MSRNFLCMPQMYVCAHVCNFGDRNHFLLVISTLTVVRVEGIFINCVVFHYMDSFPIGE